MNSLYRRSSTLLLALFCAGCGPTVRFGEVEGTLLLNGEPGHHVRVQFIPDVDQGADGPPSVADTDANGRFVLHCPGDNRPGAVVGPHRVVLTDLQLAASATGQGVPVRIPPEYCAAGTTKMRCEVKEGKQQVELRVN